MQHLTLQTLSDRALISDQLYRYAKGLDTRDWDLVACVLTDPFQLQAEMLDIDPQENTRTDQLSAPTSTHCNMQMPREGWLTRQPDGNCLFSRTGRYVRSPGLAATCFQA